MSIFGKIKDAVIDCSRLADAQKVSGAAQAEIRFRDLETVFSAPQRLQSLPGEIADRGAVEQQAV